jgi:hypothetical protein
MGGYPPTNSDEYQDKGLTEFAFRKLLILKDVIFVVLDWPRGDILPGKRKAGASSRTPHAVIYDGKYITN